MTRTLFVGEPAVRDLEIYDLVHRAQSAAIDGITAAVAAGGPLPTGPQADALARDVIAAAGHGDQFGHGTGHGIGLATHELPSLGKRAAPTTCPARPSSPSSPGSTSRARWGSGSRTSSLSTSPADGRSC